MYYSQKDYIMRMIEQFFDALAKIVHSRSMGDFDRAYKQIETQSRKYLNEEMLFFLKLSPSELLTHLAKDSRLDTEKAIICADLLLELFEVCKNDNKDAMIDVQLKKMKLLALSLYVNAIPRDEYFQEHKYFHKAENLIEELKTEEIPDDIKTYVASYREFLVTSEKKR